VYRFFADPDNIVEGPEDKEVLKLLNQTIRKVENDIENLKFNTAISALMVFNNLAYKKEKVTKETAKSFALILSPFAPHLGEELWEMYGGKKTLACEPWPLVDESQLVESTFEYPVSFNGKLRYKMELPVALTQADAESAVASDERSAKWLEGKTPKKVIVVPGKIINVVV
jgi:leucyl-tRNA synthetase